MTAAYSRKFFHVLFLLVFASAAAVAQSAKRIVILKIDGLGGELLYRTMSQTDADSGKSRLPWMQHIFAEGGTVFDNFYTRGISLSAPSWSMLDTGRHTVIRGNVEFDRYTGQSYDYLNFFPFYIGYARKQAVDMPGVEALDRAGIPLVVDRFRYGQISQSFQLFQRGVHWMTLERTLKNLLTKEALFTTLETSSTPSLDRKLAQEIEDELKECLRQPGILYLDFYIGDIDHEGHETSDPAALFDVLRRVDAIAGRVWTAIEKGPLADQTLFVVVSDHGMNNVPGIISQTFSLPDFFNSREGGAHHVVTDREQLSDFKLKGLNPLVSRVITPSEGSYYLKGQADQYPTAWLDIDGNERASIHLRNSDLNELQILLQQLAQPDLDEGLRRALAQAVEKTIERNSALWTAHAGELSDELTALRGAIATRKALLQASPKKTTPAGRREGEDKERLRLVRELQAWEHENAAYTEYLAHLHKLLAFEPDPARRFEGKVSNLIPALSLGENNSVHDLQHYVVGVSPAGFVIGKDGRLDEARTFQTIDYFPALAQQRARNNPQAQLPYRPIDFSMMRLSHTPGNAYWLYRDSENQLILFEDNAGQLSLLPVSGLQQDDSGNLTWNEQPWHDGLPLDLFEDPHLTVPSGQDRAQWLSGRHSEREWFEATHQCRYSNGVIGVTEELSPVADNVPGPSGASSLSHRYEQRRRELVQADFHVFASDHWNFNVRFPNPGGNHGSFLRISTHSVWMMAGAGVPTQRVSKPYDSLNFASTILSLLGRTPPLPDRVVNLETVHHEYPF